VSLVLCGECLALLGDDREVLSIGLFGARTCDGCGAQEDPVTLEHPGSRYHAVRKTQVDTVRRKRGLP